MGSDSKTTNSKKNKNVDIFEEFLEATQKAIAEHRERLLDISDRNNLVNLSFNPRARLLRFIDEQPNMIFQKVIDENKLNLIPLPPEENEPEDEKSNEFISKYNEAQLTDVIFIIQKEDLGDSYDEFNLESRKIIRDLKDRVRDTLMMEKRASREVMSNEDYARAHDILPKYEIEFDEDSEAEKHKDENLQTLLYEEDLRKKCNSIQTSAKSILDEKGFNTLHLSFGCLEWIDKQKRKFSPLLLLPVSLAMKKGKKKKVEYAIESVQSELSVNIVLEKRLINDFGIVLPEIKDDHTPEDYFRLLEENMLKAKPDWKIRRFITLAIHNSSRVALYNDLDPKKWEKNNTILGSQENVQTLFSKNTSAQSVDEKYDIDDPKIESKVPVLIDETDSSQFSAIVDAMSGKNMTIQGPPGTGKSTTIANMIANYLLNEKKVLFIAEKKAALDVVYKNLSDKGLGYFLFRLASTAEKKDSIIDELAHRLEIMEKGTLAYDDKSITEQHKSVKEKIRGYSKTLSEKHFVINMSCYEILSNNTKYNYYQEKYPKYFESYASHASHMEDAEYLSKSDYERKISELKTVSEITLNIIKKYDAVNKHPWFGVSMDTNNPIEISSFRKILSQLNNRCLKIITLVEEFSKNISLDFECNLTDIRKNTVIFKTSRDTPDDLTKKNILRLIKIANQNEKFSSQIKKIKEFHNNLLEHNKFISLREELSREIEFDKDYDVSKLKRHKKNIENSIFLLSSIFSNVYRESKREFTYIVRDGKYNKARAISILERLIEFLSIEKNNKVLVREIKEKYEDIKLVLEDDFNYENTNSEITNNICIFINTLPNDEDGQLLVCKNINKLDSLRDSAANIISMLDEFDKDYEKVHGNANHIQFFNYPDESINLKCIVEKIEGIDLEGKELSEFIQLNLYRRDFDNNTRELYDAFVNEQLDFSYLIHAYKYLFFVSLSIALFKKNKDISEYLAMDFNKEILKFRELDKKMFELRRDNLIAFLAPQQGPPGIEYSQSRPVETQSEMGLIKREIDKKRGRISFRQLVKRAQKSFMALKPCFMLSPVSLAEIVEQRSDLFDVVIIDEASQMTVEDSLGALLKAKQCIIVGDTEQLAPTPFFKTIQQIVPDDNFQDTDESILNLALSKFEIRRGLKWHYRSRHSSLINFSNYHFYNNSLIIPPSASDQFAIDYKFLENARYYPALKNQSDGVKTRTGVNPSEAKEVARSVIEFMKTSVKMNKSMSCIVVTMNNAQSKLIDEEINLLRAGEPLAEEYIAHWKETMEPFEVKNIERVQGDERDYVFISTLFGPRNDTGVQQGRFGPITTALGHRRLNVLFTRAKERVKLYSSIIPSKITTEGKEKGVKILKDYLEYAKIKRLDSGVITNKETDSEFEDWVKEELEKLGYIVEPQVGVSGFFIDLGIKHKEYNYGFLAGVECDGATYHSSLSARDNDIVRQRVLEGLRWKIWRIWSTDWFKDSEHELDRLDNFLKNIIKQQKKG